MKMMFISARFLPFVLCCLLLFAPAAPAWAESEGDDSDNGNIYSASGLPIPRFVSLKSDEVNLRTGPGRRYPIRWVYKQRNLPVEVIEEFGHWRRLRDASGDEGWAHKNLLTGTRMALFREDAVLRRYPEDTAPPMIRVQKGVIASLLQCDLQWCQLQIQSYKSWVRKAAIWGVYPRETL